MGLSTGPLAADAAAIDHTLDSVRLSMARANMLVLVDRASQMFGGGLAGVIMRRRDDQSILVRQIAMYVAHTVLGMRKADCARSLELSKWCATRAFHTIEERRQADEAFNAQLEQLEAVIRRWLMAARTLETQIRPVPPTQGLVKRPVAVVAAPAADLSSGRMRA